MKNRFFSADILILILSVIAAVFGAAFAFTQPWSAGIVAAVLLIVVFAILINARTARKLIKSIFYGNGKYADLQQISFEKLNIPVAIVDKDTIVWYNQRFQEEFLNGDESYLVQLDKLFPEFEVQESCTPLGYNVVYHQEEYTVYSSIPTDDTRLWVSYFINDTFLKEQSREYQLSRPIVIQIAVDTYDDVLKDLKESTRAQIMAKLDQLIEDISIHSNGVTNKFGTSRYSIMIEERYYELYSKNQFEILSRARKIDAEHSVTLSIGVGKGGKDFAENDILSRQALDMALGRGGDQAVVKTLEGYEFFGGISRSVEKRSKVKSRIVAKALKDIVVQSDNVLIMGHKLSDLDSVGSAVGIASIVKCFERSPYIVIDETKTLAKNLIEWVKQDEELANIFITPEKAQNLVDENTLLVIVDTHVARMTEYPPLCELCPKKVVIDHHRRMVDYITDSVVSYHEPYASSASELVTELTQYILPATAKLTAIQSGALLSGIMLDTRNFSEKAGVRTFEAAAYLRRQAADPAEILKIFAIPKDIYSAKATLVNNAQTYKGVAISISDEFTEELQLAVPQAANDLLMLEGVEASIVGIFIEDTVRVSARSLGDINVQVLMEHLGGGGHLTMAGAQLKNVTLEQAKANIKESIDHYKK